MKKENKEEEGSREDKEKGEEEGGLGREAETDKEEQEGEVEAG